MQNQTTDPYVPPIFSPPSYAVAVNALFFASLGVVLVAAFLCMLVRGWIRELDRKLRGIPDLKKRAVIKELREQGLLRWRFPELITILPSLIHLSLLLFFTGLTLYLLHVHKLPAILSISIFGIGVLGYTFSIFISAIDDFSPFRSPYSRALGVLYRQLYSRLAGSLNFRSRWVMALPQTPGEKIRERIVEFVEDHNPLSEQAILDPSSSSSDKVIPHTLVPILNRLGSISETSPYTKSIHKSILLQLDDLNIRPPCIWDLFWRYDITNLSVKEAECLALAALVQRAEPDYRTFRRVWAAVKVLDQSSDPWFQLVASLIQMRTNESLGVSFKRGSSIWWPLRPSFTACEADISQAIHKIGVFSAEQWHLGLSSISSLATPDTGIWDPQEIPSVTRILVRLLQKGFIHEDKGVDYLHKCIDLWLYVMTSVLSQTTLAPESCTSRSEDMLHAWGIERDGKGMTRDPVCIRELLQLSQDHNLDQPLMKGCLVSILYTLTSANPSNEREVQLVNQYLEIIGEEMDVATWSFSLSELLQNRNPSLVHKSSITLSLLRGEYIAFSDFNSVVEATPTLVHDYDLKLSATNTDPTASVLTVLNGIIFPSLIFGHDIIGLGLQNAWLSLHIGNVTRSPHTSNVPVAWPPDCTPIASERLDLYDHNIVLPERDIVMFFLSCPSASITCRALSWYLHAEEDALTRSDGQYFISFPIIFRRGLSATEKGESWSLLVDVLVPQWNDLSPDRSAHFVGNFLGYASPTASSAGVGDGGAPSSTAQADGLGWMEDVWTTVLKPPVRKVRINISDAGGYWPELLRVLHSTYPEPAGPTKPPLSVEPSVKAIEERPEDSAHVLLRVLAQFLEAGADLMPAALLDRFRNSPLLSDEHLSRDTESLNRIDAILNSNREGENEPGTHV